MSGYSRQGFALGFGGKPNSDDNLISQRVASLLLQAETALQQGGYPAAIHPAKQAYDALRKAKHPDLKQRISAAGSLANIYYGLKDYDKAKKLIEEALDLCQNQFQRPATKRTRDRKPYRECFLALSELALNLGDVYSQRAYQQLCPLSPCTPKAYKADFEKAKALFERIIRGAQAGYPKSRRNKKTPVKSSPGNATPLPQAIPPIVFCAHLGLAMLRIYKAGFAAKNTAFEETREMLDSHPHLLEDRLVNEVLVQANKRVARFYAPSNN